MRTASELEAAYSREPVRLLADDNKGTGVLSLSGRSTVVTLTTDNFINERDPDTGWFDLTLETNNGSKILLHNALTSQSGMPYGERREWEFTIFPNIVLFNAESVLPGGRVREIQFTADGLEDIFYYEIAEWQSLYNATPDTLKQVRALRDVERLYPRNYAYFSPESVYIVHRLPRVLRERVGNATYEIFLGHSQSHGRKSLTISSVAIATIRFANAVSIDEALDAAWAWRRFFRQIAMRSLPFTTLSCRGKTKRGDRHSDIYLSNMETAISRDRTEMFDFGPRDVPYGQWKHRKKFATVMRQWLERDGSRRLFRVRVDRVLERMRKESSTKLVADLCSAIESLSELRAPSTLSDADLTAIVDAAAKAGKEATPAVPRDRLLGILSLLQHQSLPRRLKMLAAAIESEVPRKDARTVIKIARDMRTFEAHGDHWDEMTVPLVAPVLDMLASMCVLWDLTTCGMPTLFEDRRLSASGWAHRSAQELRTRLLKKGEQA
ncbi:ApeA N-terminal domain 1-containing protein [Sphingobium lactosutens]|uniref:ApeA N-terminal domain-containing protein n=1 Tax=Sphingobium lactosutens DS20 TaxID=1331060 RepID=T0J3S8_9SPHN|nr:hypothetical protein [Sphingobium lactosutens]EQB16639.1 hypothetical protein RLDS_07430 [Sphingobium lactosutens DS20]